MENYIEIIQELNQEIFDKYGDDSVHEILFTLETDGFNYQVKINGMLLWTDSDDEREWIEDEDDYEPLLPFLKKEYNKFK